MSTSKINYWRRVIGEGPTDPTALPQMTTSQRDELADPQNGWVIYNSDTDTVERYSNNGWVPLSPPQIVDKSWETQAGDFTALPGGRYLVDTTLGAITMTLPFDPGVGAEVEVLDQAGTFATNNLIITGNGQNILSASQTLTLDESAQIVLVFLGNPVGWNV
jgi:hypothetical protein